MVGAEGARGSAPGSRAEERNGEERPAGRNSGGEEEEEGDIDMADLLGTLMSSFVQHLAGRMERGGAPTGVRRAAQGGGQTIQVGTRGEGGRGLEEGGW